MGAFWWIVPLAHVAHVALLSFLCFREIFVNVFDGNVWPREIVPVSNVFQPGFFRGETCRPMEVSYGFFDAW